MFLESTNRAGWIEVVCGSMFSGKTEDPAVEAGTVCPAKGGNI